MTSLKILEIKNFMAKLLLSDTFDHFMLLEAAVTTFAAFHIDGHLHRDYYSSGDAEYEEAAGNAFSLWSLHRPYCLELIKGNRSPLGFKIVFLMATEKIETLLPEGGQGYGVSDINGLSLTLKFDGKELFCTTGTSLKIFTTDKTLDHVWDEYVRDFLKEEQILFKLA